MSTVDFIDELERDLGLAARLRVIANAGGQRRYIPMPKGIQGSIIEQEFGPIIAYWLSGRFGGEKLQFPSRFGQESAKRTAALTAAILEAGLTEPTRSANSIALEFGVTMRWVQMLRRDLRDGIPSDQLDLFG